ncbi:MAG: secretion system protein [Firmicutes bacterium]|nr:secretion system protein [Bacillota bacterium]
MMLIVITILAFLTIALAVIGIMSASSDGTHLMRSRLDKYVTKNPTSPAGRNTETFIGFRKALRRMGRVFETKSYAQKLEEGLEQANLPLRGSEFVVLNLFMIVSFAGGTFIFTESLFLSLFMAAVGAFSPWIFVHIRRVKRFAAFNGQIADTLTAMSNSLRAGYSFLQAMDVVSREMPPPISEEFSRTLKDMNLGATTEDSLSSLAKRIKSDDLDLVVTAILIQRQVGGNLSEILDNIATTIRERVRIKGEIRTLTAQGRLSGLIIGMLPLGIGAFVFVVNPQYMSVLFSHPLGKLMLAYAVLNEILGALIIRRIVAIEV